MVSKIKMEKEVNGDNFGYNELNDSLFISRKKKDDKVYGSAKVGDFVFDFTKENKLVNVEIRNVTTNLLKNFGINPASINKVELLVNQKHDMIMCFFCIFYLVNEQVQEQKIPLLISTH